MKITQRLVILLLIVSLAFGAFIYLYFQIKKLEGKLYSQADALQRRQIINAFIDIKKYNIMNLVDINSVNNELVSFTFNRHRPTTRENLHKLITQKSLDIVQVYDSVGTLIYASNSNAEPELDSFRFKDDFFANLRIERRKYFTEPWRLQYLQVGASTIHTSSDSSRAGKSHGYLILAKLWTVGNLEDFSQTLDYKVRFSLTEPKFTPVVPFYNVDISIPLNSWNNTPVAWLNFRSKNPFLIQWHALGKQIVWGVLGFTIAFLIVQIVLLYYWISAPLKLISTSLKYGNPEIIHPLSNTNNEFGEIAKLIKRFFEQNQQLRNEMEERRKTEMMLRQAQKMESLGTLAGGIAHDFNNIITIISGYIALASGKTKSETDVQSNLDESMRACLRAKKLIEKILTFSRKTDKKVQPIGLTELINDTLDLLSHTIPSSIIFRTIINEDAYILADPTEIQQVIMNISSNSYHAMQYQGGTIEIELSEMSGDKVQAIVPASDKDVSYACISFKDTGTGMTQEVLDRIFDPYFSTKAPGEGTGLGLSIVHGIVTGCNGHIHISSILEHGTTVKIFIPTTTQRKVEEPPVIKIAQFIPANIVFVDDEPALADLFKESLTDAGYSVAAFSDSTEAFSYYSNNSDICDILIADIAMPNMNGIQLAQKCRQINPGLPIILYSGYSDSNVQKRCRDLQINKLLVKPVLPETLSRIVRLVLSETKPTSQS